MLSYVSMRPLPREFTPGGFLRRDGAQRFVGRKVDDAFWTDLFGANWIEPDELTADHVVTHELVVGDDDIVRLDPAPVPLPAAREGRPTDMVATAEEEEFRAIDWK